MILKTCIVGISFFILLEWKLTGGFTAEYKNEGDQQRDTSNFTVWVKYINFTFYYSESPVNKFNAMSM